jgi:hypothetical protein
MSGTKSMQSVARTKSLMSPLGEKSVYSWNFHSEWRAADGLAWLGSFVTAGSAPSIIAANDTTAALARECRGC